jgi:hypothetical protein
MNKRITLMMMVLGLMIFLVPSVFSYIPHQYNTTLEFTISSNNATECNVSAMDYPDGVRYLDLVMTKSGQVFNTTVHRSNFTDLGDYCFKVVCTDGVSFEVGSICRTITESGNENPEGITVITFSIIFFILVGWLIFTLFLNIGRIIELNADILDVSMAIIGYFGLLFYYYFSQIYFAKEFVLDMSLLFIRIGGFTHMVLPILALVLSMTLGELKKQKLS